MQSFPFEGLQPKRETQAEEFLTKHPNYNGKDVIIAILDTGVDPAAPGLQKCPDGKDKILDVVDCTGSGDVVLSEEITPSTDTPGILLGLSGSKLRIGTNWSNPSGKFRLGLIKLYDYFPDCLVKRISAERKERFVKEHSLLLAKEQAKLDQWNREHATLKDSGEVIQKEELESRIAALKILQDSYQSNGEVFNVITFHDGKHFRAVFASESEVDADGVIDLGQAVLYTDFKYEHQYGFFSKQDLLSFSVNFYSEGKVLSLVTNAGSHGTHVAAITSAYFSDAPEKNGIAPGARIISLKIGDSRLGSLETGIGLARAIKCIKEWNCHLVNMSYGEAIAYSDYGFFVREMQELVWNQGVIFVSSAGNNGPCISTVGAPGGTSSCAIGVGAYVTQSMMKAEYSLREKNPDMPYSWSSNGPTFDGDAGVTVYAPGAAITSVPLWTLSPNQRMNGTSMSSPNACGCIALVLSGLMQEGIPFSFPRLKNALLASSKALAERIPDSFLGAGLLQVDNLFENIKANSKIPCFDFFYCISVPELGGDARGIYVRRAGIENNLKKEYFNVDVSVKFPREFDNQIKVCYENHLSLCASQPWISVPDNLHLNSNGNRFQVRIDYEMIDQECSGNVHYGLIKAFDPSMSGNCIFSVPVTVVRPIQLSTSCRSIARQLIVKNGQLERVFVVPPTEASDATISVSLLADEATQLEARPSIVYLDALQINKHKKASHLLAKANAFSMLANEKKRIFVEVPSGEPIEFCFGLFWSSHGTVNLSFEVEFTGARTKSCSQVNVINSDCSFIHIPLNPLESGKQKPRVEVHSLVKTLIPSAKSPSNVKVMDERTSFAHSGLQLYELTLGYTFKLTEDSEVEFSSAATNSFLYDSFLSSFLLQVNQSDGKRVFFTSESSSRRTKTLQSGTYTVSLQLTHPNKDKLEEWKAFALSLHIFSISKLKDSSLEFYPSLVSMHERCKKLEAFTFKKNQAFDAFAVASHKELGSGAEPGDSILFSLSFDNEEASKIWIQRIIPKQPSKASEISLEKEPESALLLDGMISLYKSLDSQSNKETFALIESNFSMEPKWLLVKLQESKDNEQICTIADSLINSIDFEKVATYDSARFSSNTLEKALHSKETVQFTSLKSILTEAVYRKLVALAQMQKTEAMEEAFSLLTRLVPAVHEKRAVVYAYILREKHQKRLGNALLACVKALKEPVPLDCEYAISKKALSECECELFAALEWNCWVSRGKKAHLLNHSEAMKRYVF